MVDVICISGLVGAGKDTVADKVAKELKFQRVKLSFKDIAKQLNIPLMKYHEYAEKDMTIDIEFDKQIVKEARKTDSVVSTWLGPWQINDAKLRVWLEVSPEVRAERIAKRDEMTLKEALNHVKKRDFHNRGRYMAIYGIDIFDHSVFDLIINGGNYSADQVADIIICAYNSKLKKQ
jgi:cytidylate kinase